MAGAVALQSHLAVMDDARRKIAGLDGMEKGGQKVEAKDRQTAQKSLADATASMIRFAEYLATRWPEEELANTCRFQLGLARVRSAKYPEALALLAQVRPDSRLRPLALMQSALVIYQQAEGKSADPAARAAEVAKAVALLRQIPTLTDVSDRSLTDNYLQSRLRLAGEYYTAKDFQSLSGVLNELDTIRARLDDDTLNVYGALFQRADLYVLLLTMTRATAIKDPAGQADVLDLGLTRLAKAKNGFNAKPTVAAFFERALIAALQANRPEIAARVVSTATDLATSIWLEAPDMLVLKEREIGTYRRRKFESFCARDPEDVRRPQDLPQDFSELEADLEEWFMAKKRGVGCRVPENVVV